MKSFLTATIALLCCQLFTFGQSSALLKIPANLDDSLFSTYYQQRVSLFRTLPTRAGSTIFLGNSITDGAEWTELFNNDPKIINRGISGDMTAGVLNRLTEVIRCKPAKIFLLIGTNDLAKGISTDSILKNIYLIAGLVHRGSPYTKLYIQSLTPVNSFYGKFSSHTANSAKIKTINQALARNGTVKDHPYTYLNIHDLFTDKEGLFDTQLTNDGLHLKGDAYQRWKHFLYPYVYDLQSRPALIPLPRELTWTSQAFSLYHPTAIHVNNDSLLDLAENIHKAIRDAGYQAAVNNQSNTKQSIKLSIEKVHAQRYPNEAYQLEVTSNHIQIKANTKEGLFRGIQTFRQLLRDGSVINGCKITDEPAYSWRGYLVDVGRNYQSMDLLKRQIDHMAALKMNVFHFHCTENIAWRFQIRSFPELTDPKNMERDKGQYYSTAEIKELIHYCKDRYITFMPEIDMPGHSAAFKRALGYDMQSDAGLAMVKKILTEITDTYHFPYIHIGADEVKITNQDFVPTVTKLLQDKAVKVIGWAPGGKYYPGVIRQLWGSDKGLTKKHIQRIDSRNLYVNHMDAEASVASIFNHGICGVQKGDNIHLGGTLCLWNDRRLSSGLHNLTQNPAYPAMVSFAERAWCGGGNHSNEVFVPDSTNEQYREFAAFENRLLDIKKEFFQNEPFPYVRQANIHWKIIGPYQNKGNLAKSFAPEKKEFDFTKAFNTTSATGATIILRHFWHPAAKGVLKDPKENTTYYGYAKYWSELDTTARMWIGFYDFSRSTATNSPKAGTWNNLSSRIWLNGRVINPPDWQRAGQTGNTETPYIDENYSFRQPQTVHLKKGWNQILVKAPIGKFNSGIWYAPYKWMFTAVFVTKQDEVNWEQDGRFYQK